LCIPKYKISCMFNPETTASGWLIMGPREEPESKKDSSGLSAATKWLDALFLLMANTWLVVQNLEILMFGMHLWKTHWIQENLSASFKMLYQIVTGIQGIICLLFADSAKSSLFWYMFTKGLWKRLRNCFTITEDLLPWLMLKMKNTWMMKILKIRLFPIMKQ
jgi:hypothetical protein